MFIGGMLGGMFTIPSHGWFMALFYPHYPLVNIQKTMERSTIFNGKIHYFYGHFQ